MSPVDVGRAAAALRERLPSVPPTAVVVGSGLAALEETLVDPVAVSFGDVTGLPSAGVAGHAGRFLRGRVGDSGGASDSPTELLVQAGRMHVYEGHPLELVVAPVRILAELGVRRVIMTNAAGGIRPGLDPGVVVLVDDVINLMFRSPLAGPVVGEEARFPDMSDPLDGDVRDVVRAAALALGQRIEEGTYVAVAGPQYETAAEIRMLSRLGADVVGMSTAPEVIAAAAVGLPCAVLSLVTNRATGLSTERLSHEEVLEVGRAAGERVAALVMEVARRLDREAPPSGTQVGSAR